MAGAPGRIDEPSREADEWRPGARADPGRIRIDKRPAGAEGGNRMRTGTRVAVSLAVLAGFAGVVGYAVLGHQQQQHVAQQEQVRASAQELTGFVAVDVDPFFADARVQRILRDKGFAVKATRAGSRDMADKLAAGDKPDFWFPSGVLAANQIDDQAKKLGQSLTQATPFNSPMVVASWTPVAGILEANGIAHRTGDHVYGLNMDKLAETMLSRKRWSELKGASAYDVKRSILVSTTDVRKSNSAAMYLALMSQALNGGDVVTDHAAARAGASRLTELFKRQGFQENYVNGNFDDYVQIGIGKTPLAFIYEYQLAGYAVAHKGVQADMVLMYPEPTIVNKFVLLAASARGKALQQELVTNPELQKIAAEMGLRTADPALFAAAVKPTGLAVQDRVVQVIDPPAYELMTDMIATVATEMSQ
jgi:Bacterial extracellular solute-binding protein